MLFVTELRKFLGLTSAVSSESKRPALVNVRDDDTKMWLPGGEHHWGPLWRLTDVNNTHLVTKIVRTIIVGGLL